MMSLKKSNLKRYQRMLLAAGAASTMAAGAANAAVLSAGDTIGIDFGPTATDTVGNDFNEITTTSGAGAIAAGSVINLNTAVMDGVSVATGSHMFNNNDGSNADYATLVGAPLSPFFEESVVTDITGMFGGPVGGNTFTVTISGLDTSLTYDILAVSAADSYSNTERLTVNGGASSDITRGTAAAPTFHQFNGVSSVAGVITLDFTQPTGNNPVVSGITLTAVPEPASMALMGLGGLLMLRRRKQA